MVMKLSIASVHDEQLIISCTRRARTAIGMAVSQANFLALSAGRTAAGRADIGSGNLDGKLHRIRWCRI